MLDDFEPPAQAGPVPAGDQLLAAATAALGSVAGSVLVHNGRAGVFTRSSGDFAFGRADEVPGSADEPELSESDDEVSRLYQRALDLVQVQFETRTWQAFWRVAMENRSPAEVAAELGMTPNTVRQSKSRVLRRLKEELGELIA